MHSYCTLQELADRLQLNERTIRRLVARRQIPFTRINRALRFPIELIDDWARDPEQVAARWFAGKEVASKDSSDVSEKTAGEALGRALFLHGPGRLQT